MRVLLLQSPPLHWHSIIRMEIPAHCRLQTPSKSRRTTKTFRQKSSINDKKKKKNLVVLGCCRRGRGGCWCLIRRFKWSKKKSSDRKTKRWDNYFVSVFSPSYLSPSLLLSVFMWFFWAFWNLLTQIIQVQARGGLAEGAKPGQRAHLGAPLEWLPAPSARLW